MEIVLLIYIKNFYFAILLLLFRFYSASIPHRSIDDMLDARSTQLGKTMDHTVFDSRLAWHFVEKSFKVFLLVDTQEAARRVYEGNSRSAQSVSGSARSA